MRKPNYIIIYCDDLGYGDLGCYGSQAVKSPHLDELATQGIRFTNWYANSPVCSPSRAALLTGKYPLRAGVSSILGGKRGTAGLSPEQQTIAARLKAEGYRTSLFGKWHLGMAEETSPNAHGFDSFFGFKAGCVDYFSHIFYWGMRLPQPVLPVHDLWHNNEEVWRNGHYMTDLITEQAVSFIQQESEQPFLMYVAYNAPHYPMHAPQRYMDRYKGLPWDRQVMAAMISAVDDGVGAIVEALKQTGEYEHTVIFFSSDNGPSSEAVNWLDGNEDFYYGGSTGYFRGHKASLFDGGIREPAILSYPARLPGGRVNEELVAMIDIVPTFLEWAGLEDHLSDLDGRSLIPMLEGSASGIHDTLYWEYQDQLAIRQGNWKLVLNGKLDFSRPSPDPVHLSNLESDPGERLNLAAEHPKLVQELSGKVKRWYEKLASEMGTEVNPHRH